MDHDEYLGELQHRAELPSQVGMDVTVDAANTGELQDVVSQFPQDEGYGDLLSLVGNTEYYE